MEAVYYGKAVSMAAELLPGIRGLEGKPVIATLTREWGWRRRFPRSDERGHVRYKLAHILCRPAMYDERPGVDPELIEFESLAVADSIARPRVALPAYFGHGAQFIRIALHLCHRAEHRYGLSPALEYQDALGDEANRLADLLFRDIHLWTTDAFDYQERFSHLKGALP